MKGKQGFASMNPELLREIASKGGKAAHSNGTAHRWTSEEAKEASLRGKVERRRKKETANDGNS